jgi:hypothetical protein
MDKQSEIDRLSSKLTGMINSYCNTFGCKECPIKEYVDNKEVCEVITIQNKVMELEFENNKL